MPTIRSNTAVDSSQIAGMFDPIAKALKPDTAQEILAAAKARQIGLQNGAFGDLYSRAGRQDLSQADQEAMDRQAAVAQFYSPNQSLTAVRMNEAAAGARNAADNARALQTNTADNQNKITLKLMDPLSADQSVSIPPSVASMYNVPQERRGIVKVNEGQNAVLPNGETISGVAKPLSLDQSEAADYAKLPETTRQGIVKSKAETQIVMTPEGPRVVMRGNAEGLAPGSAPSAEASKPTNYRTPDGKEGLFVMENGRPVDAVSRAPLPEGVTQFGTQVTGKKDDVLGPSAENTAQSQYMDIMDLKADMAKLRAIAKNKPSSIGTVGSVLGLGQDAMATSGEVVSLLSPKAQKYVKDMEGQIVDPSARGYFDPTIPQANMLENSIVARVAKMRDPNGRLSDERMKTTAQGLGATGWLKSASRTNAVLDLIEQEIAEKSERLRHVSPTISKLQDAETARTGAPAAPAATPAPAAPAGAQVRRRYNPQTGALE